MQILVSGPMAQSNVSNVDEICISRTRKNELVIEGILHILIELSYEQAPHGWNFWTFTDFKLNLKFAALWELQ